MNSPPPPYPGTHYDAAYPQYPAPNQPAFAPTSQPPYPEPQPQPYPAAYPAQQPPPYPSSQPGYGPPPDPYAHQGPYQHPPPAPPQPQQPSYTYGGGNHYHQSTQNTVVVMQPQQTRGDVVVVKDEEVNSCAMDCEECGDNCCGRCCADMWKCDRYHKWYSMSGKGFGWILLLILFYLIAGTVGLVFCLVAMAVICLFLSGGD